MSVCVCKEQEEEEEEERSVLVGVQGGRDSGSCERQGGGPHRKAGQVTPERAARASSGAKNTPAAVATHLLRSLVAHHSQLRAK